MPSCALTSSYALSCDVGQGGVIELYFIEKGNVTAITEVSGVVTAITKAPGAVFRKYEQEQETASLVETFNANVQQGSQYYQQELVVVVNKMETAKRNEFLLLNKNRLIAVVKDSNGNYWLAGKTRSLRATAGTSGTGTAGADRNGYTFTYTAMEPEMAPNVSDATVATLLTPGS